MARQNPRRRPEIEAYVVAIVPVEKDDEDRLAAELPAFMKRAREQYDIDTTYEADNDHH